MSRALTWAMIPPALAYNIAAHLVGVAWDGYWEVARIIRTGGRG